MKVLERHIGDKKMLHLIDCSLGDCNELLIGRYISQLLINPFITPLDRFIKEELKARHYFRIIDDGNILHDDKRELHERMHRIMNFAWYNLGLEVNRKRQIYKVGDTSQGRGIDFAGYVYRKRYTRLRKRIKKAFVRKRARDKSVPSYIGIAKHCDARNLIQIVEHNRNNKMDLAELRIEKIQRPFEGDKINIDALVGKPIRILDFEVRPSEKRENTDYLKMQIEFEGRKRFVGGGFRDLCGVLKQVDKTFLPLDCTIMSNRGYYFKGTIEE
jgi:hypothetical protein